MPTTPSATRMALFDQSAGYAIDVLADVTPADLCRPTPCDEWDVRAVALHIADVADAVIDLTTTGQLVMPKPRPATTSEPVAVAVARIQALRDCLDLLAADPAKTDLFLDATQGGANELAIHAWDLAAGLGLNRPIPDETAAGLLALIDGHLDEEARGANFGPAVQPTHTATPSDRLVTYLGRQPR